MEKTVVAGHAAPSSQKCQSVSIHEAPHESFSTLNANSSDFLRQGQSNSDNTTSALNHNSGDLLEDFGASDGANTGDEDLDAPLSWSFHNRACNLSDWTIIVTPRSDTGNNDKNNQDDSDGGSHAATMTTYHVHKNILAVGPRRSKYFASIFRCSRTDDENPSHIGVGISSSEKTSTTYVDLENTAADSFSVMLDFVYNNARHESHYHGNCYNAKNAKASTAASTITAAAAEAQISTKNAVALRHLARTFRIRNLYELATSFVVDDLGFWTAASTYLPEAVKYDDAKLIERAVQICVEQVEDGGEDAFGEYPIPLFRLVFVDHADKLRCDSEYLSLIVADYFARKSDCIHRRRSVRLTSEGSENDHNDDDDDDDELEEKLLLDLLDDVSAEHIMPKVDPIAAFTLLQWDTVVRRRLPNPVTRRNGTLRARCIEALSRDWMYALANPLQSESMTQERMANRNVYETGREEEAVDGATSVEHRKLDPSVQIHLLEQSIRQALFDMEKKDEKLEQLKRKAEEDFKKRGNEILMLKLQLASLREKKVTE